MVAEKPPEKRAEAEGAGTAVTPMGGWLRTQLLAAILLALVLVLVGPVAAYSSMLGSLAALVPAIFFAVFVGRRIGQDSAAFLQAAVVGEALKLLTTALICAMVFRWVRPLAAAWFFAGMITVIAAGWVGLARGLKTNG